MALTDIRLNECQGLNKRLMSQLEEVIGNTNGLINELNSFPVYSAFVGGTSFGQETNNRLNRLSDIASNNLNGVMSDFNSSMNAFIVSQSEANSYGTTTTTSSSLLSSPITTGTNVNSSLGDVQRNDVSGSTSSVRSYAGNPNQRVITETPSQTVVWDSKQGRKIITRSVKSADNDAKIQSYFNNKNIVAARSQENPPTMRNGVPYTGVYNGSYMSSDGREIKYNSVYVDGYRSKYIEYNKDGLGTIWTEEFGRDGKITKAYETLKDGRIIPARVEIDAAGKTTILRDERPKFL